MEVNLHYYQRYQKLIDFAKSRVEPIGYKERHHILPRCLGGTDDKTNLVWLTAREHYLAHWLLTKCYKSERATKKMLHAFGFMCANPHKSCERKLTAVQYDRAKRAMSEGMKGHKRCVGRVLSQETKDRIRESRKRGLANGSIKRPVGELNGMYGKKLTDEHKRKMSLAITGRKMPAWVGEKISKANTGKKKKPFDVSKKIRYSLATLTDKAKEKQMLVCKWLNTDTQEVVITSAFMLKYERGLSIRAKDFVSLIDNPHKHRSNWKWLESLDYCDNPFVNRR